jgi:hypothetical protein
MIEDSTSKIEAYRCWVCGNRSYVNHPKRSGLLTCVKCGGMIEEKNALNYCRKCWDGLQVFRKRDSGGSKRSSRNQRPRATERNGKAGIGKRRP